MEIKHITIDEVNQIEESVIGLGNFDGVHLGHKKIINKVIELAKRKNIKSSILSFSQPLDLIIKKDFIGELTPLNAKADIFEKLGIDILYVLKFDKDVASVEPLKFIEFLKKLQLNTIVVGDDYKFGKFGKGDNDLLKQHFNVEIVDYVLTENGLKISSSNIIEMIKRGQVDIAAKYLGRNYFISGNVERGLRNGHKIGFPTANINYDGFVLPKYGVYEVKLTIDDSEFRGICNVGTHPTIDQLIIPSLEVHILDFHQSIYDKIVKVEFIRFLREEIEFKNVNNLKKQINLDTFSNF